MAGQQTIGPDIADGADSIRVLYVDTAEESETVQTRLATREHLVVEHVSSVAAALDSLSDTSVDCIVAAYDLPDQSGVDFLESVREHWPEHPFVLFTDDGDVTVAKAAIDANVSAYLDRTPLAEQVPELVETVLQAVQKHRNRSAILDRMTDGFLAVDEDWTLTYLNERGYDVISQAADRDESDAALVGSNLWDLVPEAVDTKFYTNAYEAMERQEPITYEEQYEPLDTWFEVRTYPSSDGLSVYFQDITDRKQRVTALSERERVLEEMYRVVSSKDMSFEEQVGRLVSIGREVLGTDAGVLSRLEGDEYIFETVQDPGTELEPGDRVPLEQTNCERAIVTEETLVLEDIARVASEHPEYVPVSQSGVACYLGTPVVVDGDVSGTFCFYNREPRTEPFSDWEVTLVELLGNWISYERERQQHRRELTRERNRMQEFASVVSHDLRNPLGVALGRIDIARETGAAQHFDAIERSLERMDALIEDVLTVAREGEAVEDPAVVDLGRIAEEAWSVVDSADATLDNRTTGQFVADARRLQRLLENLFRNAIEHAGYGVSITVGDLDDGRGLYVADDGLGIPPEERKQVFEPGFTTSEDGTGFGLKIVAEIVQAHGATVNIVESADGGTRFEIRNLDVE